MYPSPTSTPTPDAAVVPIGRGIARSRATKGTVLILIAAFTVYGLAKVAARPSSVSEPEIILVAGSLLALLLGAIGAAFMRQAWRRRGILISADFAGLWISDGDEHAVIPWSAVELIGLHVLVRHYQGLPVRDWSLDLLLHDPIESDHPLLKRHVLPAGPPRYMMPLPRGAHKDVMAAVKARVPELWRALDA